MSTLAGHSVLHALQLKQRDRACSRSSDPKRFAPVPLNSWRNRFARPRVESRSSRVAIYDGHITPPDAANFRHTPAPLHRPSAAPKPPSARHRKPVGTGAREGTENIGAVLKSDKKGAGCTIRPGFSRFCGSQRRLTSSRTGMISVPIARSMNGALTRPSPCSPESDPRY